MDSNSVRNNPQSNNLIHTEAEQEIKHEILELCRICETVENLIDISHNSFQHLNKQLHGIANVEEKYDYCLKYICTQCSKKVENSFYFKTQCEFTYKKLIDQLEGKDFANILPEKASNGIFNKDKNTILVPPFCKIESEDDGMMDTIYFTNILKNINCPEEVEPLSAKLRKDNNEKGVGVSETSIKNEGIVPDPDSDNGVDFITTLATAGNSNENLSSDYAKESEVEAWSKKYRKIRLWDHSYMKMPLKPSEFGMTPSEFEKSTNEFDMLFSGIKDCPSKSQKRNDPKGNPIQQAFPTSIFRKIKLKKKKKEPKIFTCEICEKSFFEKYKLKLHMETIHLKLKNHACNVCERKFIYRAVLKQHIRSKHTAPEDLTYFECDICGKKIKTKYSLRKHKETHLGPGRVMKYKNIICDICGASFKDVSNFKYHMNKHNGIRPYKCDICGKSYMRPDVLKSHIESHNKTTSFACQYCAKEHESIAMLLKHLWIHKKTNDYTSIHNSTTTESGEKLYRCTECPRIFKSKAGLIFHKKIHKGAKPYECFICSKTFTSKVSLKSHMVSHAGERNYKCSNCLKTYRYNPDYYAHIKTCLSKK